MDVGSELAEAGRHTALGRAGADPGAGAARVGQQLLDVRSRGGLERGHRSRTDENAVERHEREVVTTSPLARQVGRSDLRRTDAATDADDDVVECAQLAVGGDQQVVEVLPRVVTAGLAALDLHDDRRRGDLLGDRDDLADLLDRAGLEDDMRDVGIVQLGDQRDGIVELGDACRDDDGIDRRTGGAGTLDEALLAQLQLPQVGIKEQRVELVGASRGQQLVELGHTGGEDRLGDLSTAGKLGPEAGIGSSCDDLGINSRRRHTGQQDR